MSWWKRFLLPVALVAACVAPARAQLNGHPVEASVGAGIQSFDARDFLQDSPSFTGALGYRWSDVFTWEASFTGSTPERDEDDAHGHRTGPQHRRRDACRQGPRPLRAERHGAA